MPFSALYQSVQNAEFKFIVKEGTQKVVRWEEGKNHIINLEVIQKQIAEGLSTRGVTNISRIPSGLQLELPKSSNPQEDKYTVDFGKKVL